MALYLCDGTRYLLVEAHTPTRYKPGGTSYMPFPSRRKLLLCICHGVDYESCPLLCNNAYCINEKKAIKLLETFEHKPEKYTEKVNHIFEVLGISLFECYDMTEKLYNEVNEIVSEINNFLNEENSDERKQI